MIEYSKKAVFKETPVLYIVIPCYNEEKVLPVTLPLFLQKLMAFVKTGEVSDESKILLVDNDSSDSTWSIIKDFNKNDSHFAGIRQNKNRGHQSNLLAGLMTALNCGADITISIDCDGQDDINAMDEMVSTYKNGCDVVYGVRSARKTDSFLKRLTAETFYKLLNNLGGEVVFNHADYRLLSRRVLDELANFKEVNLFLRGIIPLVGFKSSCVYYDRIERQAGKSHYNIHSLFSLATNGITSLSIKPIRLITSLGGLVSFVSFIGIVWVFISYFVLRSDTISGWASTVCIICFLSGIQLLSLGVIGEYVGKIYMETKHRPRFIICDKTNNIEQVVYDTGR